MCRSGRSERGRQPRRGGQGNPVEGRIRTCTFVADRLVKDLVEIEGEVAQGRKSATWSNH